MQQRPPLNRRKSFWFGMLILIFLGWASWQSFQKPYWLHGLDTGTHTIGFARMNGTTYILQEWPGTSKGIVHEPIGSMYPPVFVRHWKDMGTRVRGIPDFAMAGLFVLVWAGGLAWLEKKGGTNSATTHRG